MSELATSAVAGWVEYDFHVGSRPAGAGTSASADLKLRKHERWLFDRGRPLHLLSILAPDRRPGAIIV